MGLRSAVRRLFASQDDLDLTTGSILGPLAVLALPIVFTNVVQTLYTLVDTFWLGRYSTASLAAITLSYPLVFLLLSVAVGLPVAGSIHVAQATGSGDHRQAARIAAQAVTYSLVAALAIGAVGFLAVDDVLALFDVTAAVRRQAVAYVSLLSLGLPTTVGFVAFLALMRGSGDTITPIPVILGSLALNATLDPLLIQGRWIAPELGIRGAAVATLVARGLAAAVGLAVLCGTTRGLGIRRHQFWPDLSWGRRLVRTGLPTSLEEIVRGLSVSGLLLVVGTFSTAVVAGFGIGIRVVTTVVLATIGVSNAVETMTGQNAGAGRFRRVVRTNYLAAAAAFAVLTAVAAVCWVAARPLVGLFSTDPATVEVGTDFLRWVVPTFGCVGAMRAFVGGFRGIGKTAVSAAIVILTVGLVRLPAAWLGAQSIGPAGVWIAIAASNVLGAGLALSWFTLDVWRDRIGSVLGTPTAAGADAAGDD